MFLNKKEHIVLNQFWYHSSISDIYQKKKKKNSRERPTNDEQNIKKNHGGM